MFERRGFTLVEIMIVVAIIALLAAIAIPNLLRAKHNANESAALNSLTKIRGAMESYHFTQIPHTYPTGLAVLANSTPPYIDERLGVGQKQGYSFMMFVFGGGADITQIRRRYFCWATPLKSRVTGTRQFLYSNFAFGAWSSGTIYVYDPDNPGWVPLGS